MTPRGSDENFSPATEIVGKFDRLARSTLPAPRVAELRDAVLRLEELPSAARLAELLKR